MLGLGRRSMRDDNEHDALAPLFQRCLASRPRDQHEQIVGFARSLCRTTDALVRRASMFVPVAEREAGSVDTVDTRRAVTLRLALLLNHATGAGVRVGEAA